jgi:hypothetical protein
MAAVAAALISKAEASSSRRATAFSSGRRHIAAPSINTSELTKHQHQRADQGYDTFSLDPEDQQSSRPSA